MLLFLLSEKASFAIELITIIRSTVRVADSS
jgi:hypothetical protein